MAQTTADAQDVVENLSQQVGYLMKENAILAARLANAERQIDELSSDGTPPTPVAQE